MNPNMMCSRCKKRLAVVFLTRMDGDKPVNEGLCLKCAKELNIKAVTDLLDKMGITDEQLDAMERTALCSSNGTLIFYCSLMEY